jgi:hypothetical protein
MVCRFKKTQKKDGLHLSIVPGLGPHPILEVGGTVVEDGGVALLMGQCGVVVAAEPVRVRVQCTGRGGGSGDWRG